MQGGILLVLWTTLPDYSESNDASFCHHNSYLDYAVLAVFYANLAKSFADIYEELKLISTKRILYNIPCTCKKHKHKLLVVMNFSWLMWLRLFLVICLELFIWASVAIVGTKYILTSPSTSDIIQASVAVTFINDIDNFFFDAFILDTFKKDMENVSYEAAGGESLVAKVQKFMIKNIIDFYKRDPNGILLKEYRAPKNVRLEHLLYYVSWVINLFGCAYLAIVPIVVTVYHLRESYCETGWSYSP